MSASAPASGRTRRWLLLLLDLALAVAGGVLFAGASPRLAWWPLAFLGVGLLLVSIRRGGPWRAALLGAVGGLSYWCVLISWLTLYLGPVPWLGLAGAMTVYFALSAALISFAVTGLRALSGSAWIRLGAIPLAIACIWVARESISAVWPFGGFSWGRVAMTQSESPFTHLVSYLGFNGLSLVVVWLVALALELFAGLRGRLTWQRAGLRALLVAAILAVLVLVPAWPTATTGTLSVGAAQGDGPAGIFDPRSPGDVLNTQLQASQPLIGQKMDVLVWPEGAADLSPLVDPAAADAIDHLSARIGAPILLGTVTEQDGVYHNSAILWQAGQGETAQYDKVHPVPFAEYMPARDFFHLLAPDLVDLVQLDYAPGTGPSVMDVDGVPAGVMICFDVTDDRLADAVLREGGQLVLLPTNNADFGRTDQTFQQAATARLRAIELGRSVVSVSTVGITAAYAPDGSVIQELPPFEAGAFVAQVPLSQTTTPAVVLGSGLTAGVMAAAVLGIAAGVAGRVRRALLRKRG